MTAKDPATLFLKFQCTHISLNIKINVLTFTKKGYRLKVLIEK